MTDDQWKQLKLSWEEINDNMERIELFLKNVSTNAEMAEEMLERWIKALGVPSKKGTDSNQ